MPSNFRTANTLFENVVFIKMTYLLVEGALEFSIEIKKCLNEDLDSENFKKFVSCVRVSRARLTPAGKLAIFLPT